MTFWDCGELLKRFSFKMKGKVYKSYSRSAMLYGSETQYSQKKVMAILRRTERAMCGVNLIDRRNAEELWLCWI